MAKPRSARRYLWVAAAGILAAVLAMGAFVVWRGWRTSQDSVSAASCSNHFIQLAGLLRCAAEDSPNFILPATDDTRAALRAIRAVSSDNMHTNQWIAGSAAACPDSFYRDGSIGYIYVGDGLRLGDVVERDILILFDPATSHRRLSEHCRGWSSDRGGIKWCMTNAEMIAELERAISRGESREVLYSPRAMSVLRRELAARQR